MRCAQYCCGESYNINKILKYYNNKNFLTTLHEPEVLHVRCSVKNEDNNDIFIFSYGCIVFWGFDIAEEEAIVEELKIFLNEPLKKFVVDTCKFQISGFETYIEEENDLINLEADDSLIKLSLSYGLSQSCKLISFEDAVDATIEATKYIPNEIIKTGKVSLSRKTIAIKIGQLFAVRNSINLHSTILDTPEFFWRRPKYQPYYEMSVEFMDNRPRIEILNKRLDAVHELYDILSNELKYVHSSRLELIIIYLILIEVLIAVFRDLLGWF